MQIESIGATASLNRLDIMLAAMESELEQISWKLTKETDMLVAGEFSAFQGKIDIGTKSIKKLAALLHRAESCTAEHNPIKCE